MRTKARINEEIKKIDNIIGKATPIGEYGRYLEARAVLLWVLGASDLTPTTLVKNLSAAEQAGRDAAGK